MNFLSKSSLVFVLFIFPLTIHSTDISISSGGSVEMQRSVNGQIVPGDPKLGNTILVVSAPTEQKDIHVVTSCEHRESVLFKESKEDGKTTYIIRLSFPVACEDSEIAIGDRENIFTDTASHLLMIPLKTIEDTLINTNSEELFFIANGRTIEIPKSTASTIEEKINYLGFLYTNLYSKLWSEMAQQVLRDREDGKYISPVHGYGLSKNSVLIPGANRGYRRDTTDGIHHGWDIMAPYGTPVQSLYKGKIIRIVNNWTWADFGKIKKGNITNDDRLTNLDIFRGNQIWLQTMDGNVTFYSHLSKIAPDIQVGDMVEAGTYLGNIGTSGVPDRNYKNIHLHFEIQQNPFQGIPQSPSYIDIMRWNYIGKGLKKDEVYIKMTEIFK